MYDFRTRLCDLLDKLNGTTTLENAINDQVYLKLKKKKQKKKKNEKEYQLLKIQMSFLKEDEGLLMPLRVEYFQ